MTKSKIGSLTAKGGFLNENDICQKIINYKDDNEAKQWLEIMGYDSDKIDFIEAIQIPVRIKGRVCVSLGFQKISSCIPIAMYLIGSLVIVW
jgi:hypothetical protein